MGRSTKRTKVPWKNARHNFAHFFPHVKAKDTPPTTMSNSSSTCGTCIDAMSQSRLRKMVCWYTSLNRQAGASGAVINIQRISMRNKSSTKRDEANKKTITILTRFTGLGPSPHSLYSTLSVLILQKSFTYCEGLWQSLPNIYPDNSSREEKCS